MECGTTNTKSNISKSRKNVLKLKLLISVVEVAV